MKITKLTIKDFCGIAHLEADIPPDGAIAKGGNARGKTTVLRAIHAALAAQGVGPEAIRIGAERAEIMVDLDALRVRRAITAKGNTLTVTNAQGDKWSKPQSRLTELLGATLDPLAFFLASPAERRKQILAAMPVTCTAEDCQRWTGEAHAPEDGQHGLETIAVLRQRYYDRRTDVNRSAKASAETARVKREAADAARAAAPGAALEVGAARAHLADAMAAITALEQRRDQASEQERRTAGTRERIAKLRADAQAMQAAIVGPVDAEDRQYQEHEVEQASAEVERLTAELADAKGRLETARVALRRCIEVDEKAKKDQRAADALRGQADELEATLAETAIAAPTPEEIAAAADAACKARDDVDASEAMVAADTAWADYEDAKVQADADAAAAEELDAIVDTLTNKAPAELAARSEMIPGLAIDGAAITLDGRALDQLSGAEQLRFAVDLAKRASKAKILVVDGLERLDATRLREFVAYACAGGWQLLATKVTDGDLSIEAIEPGRVTVVEPSPAEAS